MFDVSKVRFETQLLAWLLLTLVVIFFLPRKLMERWLFNVNAVRTQGETLWWNRNDIPAKFQLGEFVGQGRRMRYYGLVEAVISEYQTPMNPPHLDLGLDKHDWLARDIRGRLGRGCSPLWLYSAVIAFILVWIPILSAFTVAFTSPTVGVGCWSGAILTYGVLCSFSWVVSVVVCLCKGSCSPRLRVICHFFNFLALSFLLAITTLVVSSL